MVDDMFRGISILLWHGTTVQVGHKHVSAPQPGLGQAKFGVGFLSWVSVCVVGVGLGVAVGVGVEVVVSCVAPSTHNVMTQCVLRAALPVLAFVPFVQTTDRGTLCSCPRTLLWMPAPTDSSLDRAPAPYPCPALRRLPLPAAPQAAVVGA
jgi:hypothetical protein